MSGAEQFEVDLPKGVDNRLGPFRAAHCALGVLAGVPPEPELLRFAGQAEQVDQQIQLLTLDVFDDGDEADQLDDVLGVGRVGPATGEVLQNDGVAPVDLRRKDLAHEPDLGLTRAHPSLEELHHLHLASCGVELHGGEDGNHPN